MKKYINILYLLCCFLSLVFAGCADNTFTDETDQPSSTQSWENEMIGQVNTLRSLNSDNFITVITRNRGIYDISLDNGKHVKLTLSRTPVLTIDPDGYWKVNGTATGLVANCSEDYTPVVTVGDGGFWCLDGIYTRRRSALLFTPQIAAVVEKWDKMVFVFSDGSPISVKKQMPTPYCDNQKLPIGCDTLRVLALGNSYTLDAIAYLHELVRASGIDLKRLVVYVGYSGGASLKYWSKKCMSDEVVHIARAAGDLTMKKKGTLRELLAQNWDVVCLQQNSAGASDYTTFNPYLRNLIDQIKNCCPNKDVALAWQMVWNYWSGFNGRNYLPGRYQLICEALKQEIAFDGIDIVIPIGTAIENARHSSLQTSHDLTRDGTHISFGVGRYIAACTWFESIIAPVFGESVVGNPMLYQLTEEDRRSSEYESLDVTEERRLPCQLSASYACVDHFHVNPVDSVSRTK